MKPRVLPGAVQALLSAVLFGISPVLLKLTVGDIPPLAAAGFLYLGSAVCLTAALARPKFYGEQLRQLWRTEKLRAAGMILSGGILGPLCLMYGLNFTPAFDVAALLNTEAILTTLIAVFIFRERISGQVWAGNVLVLAGAAAMIVSGRGAFSFASLLTVGACFFWAVDNNLTRHIAGASPVFLAGIKGLTAGLFNLLLAALSGQRAGSGPTILSVLVIGAVCYGLCLVLFIHALRKIGAARTGTFFSSAPFVGMLLAVVTLGERPPLSHWAAALFMLAGITVLFRENRRGTVPEILPQ